MTSSKWICSIVLVVFFAPRVYVSNELGLNHDKDDACDGPW